MVGKYYIKVRRGKVSYEVEFERAVTVIKGESGTGKSTLIKILLEYLNNSAAFVEVDTNAKGIFVLEARTHWEEELLAREGYLVFADENIPYITSKDFASVAKRSKNYFVFITRDKRFRNISYSVNEIYSFEAHRGRKESYTVNKLFRLYKDYVEDVNPDIIVTEDSASGFNMINKLFGSKCKVISSYGKDTMVECISNMDINKSIYAIVDGAAFGSGIEDLVKLKENLRLHIFAPESFEYLLLKTKLFNSVLGDELEKTYNYAHSTKYFTWEIYYEYLISELCKKLPFRIYYNKDNWSNMSPVFKKDSFFK